MEPRGFRISWASSAAISPMAVNCRERLSSASISLRAVVSLRRKKRPIALFPFRISPEETKKKRPPSSNSFSQVSSSGNLSNRGAALARRRPLRRPGKSFIEAGLTSVTLKEGSTTTMAVLMLLSRSPR
ncbi:MAG: hypothetical protein BWY86_01272 [Candidatus Aminicenantes bacterium ADurb.Bin508]|nr:MAG: hypothetical protein BWY86_01272 [Candidatus Aminicenantes bacterium ADurb.Bin508]